MKVIDSNNQLQNEALLNEYKGNLFEYLVGHHLARAFSFESHYLLSINQDHKLRLSMYEEFVRINYSSLIDELAIMAYETAMSILKYTNELNWNVLNIHLIGKSVATNNLSLWGETDLVLETDRGNHNLSLKLSKDHSFTNTKSAGVKSFIEKYFSKFSSAHLDQLKFTHEIDFQFNKMGEALYNEIGLNFHGAFDDQWKSHYSELPGELIPAHREIVFRNYQSLNKFLYQIIEKYFLADKTQFIQSLLPLIGLSDPNIIQVTTFHKNHQYESTKIFEFKDLNLKEDKVFLLPLKTDSHQFEIVIDQIILQIRIKPMNKFTTASYKVNCSVKEKTKE